MSEMASMSSAFPLLLPLDASQLKYDGFIQVKDKEFRLRIELPPDKNLKSLRLFGEWQLVHHLRGCEDLLQTRLQSVPDVTTFLVELQNILQSRLDDAETPEITFETLTDTSVFQRVIQDIDEVGWHRVTYIDSSFFKFHFTSTDSEKREHRLQVNISSKYPYEAPDCTVDLPCTFVPQWSEKSSLKHLLVQFEDFLKQFNDLWLQLEEFDQRTVVIEPEKPRKSDVNRRVYLGNHTSIQMTLNPSHPRMCPDCRFLGADHVVTRLRKLLNSGLSSWDMTATVLTNMERVLNLKFPEPTSQSKQDLGGECGICYTYRLESGIPDTVCDNTQCSKPYHQSCLYEWLRSLSTGGDNFGFNKVSGECLYCGTQITIGKPL